jgi:hypothetical protein
MCGLHQGHATTSHWWLLGWQPTQPGLIEDIDQGHYFRELSVR